MPHVHSSNKAHIIPVILPVTFFPLSFLPLSLSLSCFFSLSLAYKGMGCHSLKGTALTSMAFFSCLARHQTPAQARPLAPQTAGLSGNPRLDQNKLELGTCLHCQLDGVPQTISRSTELLSVLHFIRIYVTIYCLFCNKISL